MGRHKASRSSVTIAVGVARDLEVLLRRASGKRRLNGRQRALFKKYAGVLKARLNRSRQGQIRVSKGWCLVVLRFLACLLEHSQDLRRMAERMMGGAK